MKTVTLSATAILLALPVLSTFFSHRDRGMRQPQAFSQAHSQSLSDVEAKASGSGKPQSPCSPPTKITSTLEETAWRLWVAATCPVNVDQYPYVVWENWIEQDQMFPADPSNGLKVPNSLAQASPSHLLHASPLALTKNPGLTAVLPGLLGGADQNCNKSGAPPLNQPNLTICEEVRLNGATEDYMAGTNIWNRKGQAQLAAHGANVQFPAPAVEIKADWIQLSSIGYHCDSLPAALTRSVHVETVQGDCYAMVGMHLTSKLTKNWIWATFEPQNSITNPNRCKELGCTDLFGSKPVQTFGTNTQLTRALSDLMTAANLTPEWRNYRLDGVQILFTEGGQPTLLGNSIIEGENAGVPLKQSSCISCHAVSSVKGDGTDGIGLLNTVNPVGNPDPLPSSDWIRRDFVWSLFKAQ